MIEGRRAAEFRTRPPKLGQLMRQFSLVECCCKFVWQPV